MVFGWLSVLVAAKKMRNQIRLLITIFSILKHIFALVVADIFIFKNRESKLEPNPIFQ
jgi:hypothetical protein